MKYTRILSSLLVCMAPPVAAQVQFPLSRTDVAIGSNASDLALADFNGNGAPDLAWTSPDTGRVTIALGAGDGTFGTGLPVTVLMGASRLAAGQLDSDGRPDLAVLSDELDQVSLFLGNGDGTFTPAGSVGTPGDLRFVTLADLDGDGLDELIVAEGSEEKALVGVNAGAAIFSQILAVPLLGSAPNLAVGDLNGDGFGDLVASGDGSTLGSIVLGGPGFTFQPAQLFPILFGGSPLWIDLGDLNGDGWLDAIASEDDGLEVDTVIWPGLGDGTFGPSQFATLTGASPLFQTIGDYNGDGDLDFVAFQKFESNLVGWGGLGADLLYPSGFTPAASDLTALVAADLDGDGDEDLVSANGSSASLSIFLSEPQSQSFYGTGFFAASSGFKQQHLAVQFGAAQAGHLYLVAGSASGTAPGAFVDGLQLPLNLDSYTAFTVTQPNTLISGSLGTLNAAGAGNATFDAGFAPLSPALAGTTLHHAFLAVHPFAGQVSAISEAFELALN